MTDADRFVLEFVRGAPPANEVCVVAQPTYLHRPFRIYFFGHMLRDNFHAIAFNLHRLGRSQHPYQLALWRYQNDRSNPKLDTPSKYAALVASDLVQWKDLVQRNCTRRYVRFKDLIAGFGGLDLRGHDPSPHLCNNATFSPLRSLAYARAGIKRVPVRQLPGFMVLFADKPLKDKRRVVNLADEVIPALQTRFPHFDIRAEVLSALSTQRQLELLSNASVFVSPVGSASFRLLFLNDGAHAVLVGSPEARVGGPGGGWDAQTSFREARHCWDHLEYVRVMRYHIRERDEFEARYARAGERLTDGAAARFRMWDADTRLKVGRIAAMIEDAARVSEA